MRVLDLPPEKTHWLRGHQFHLAPSGWGMLTLALLSIGSAFAFHFTTGNELSSMALLLLGALFAIKGADWAFSPVRWKCPGCKRPLNAREPWRCGLCSKENRKKSFLERCENPSCDAEPGAYECQHCKVVTFLTKARDGRNPARSLNVPLAAPGPTPLEQIREQRTIEIGDREHERSRLRLDIDIKRLRDTLNPPELKAVDSFQEKINGSLRDMDHIVLACETIEQSIVRQRAYNERIDATDYDPFTKRQLKDLASKEFEKFRMAHGGDIPLYEKDHQ